MSKVGRQRVADAPGGVHRTYSYVERGFYAGQIERVLRSFPRDQVMFLRNDELWSDPLGTLSHIEAFLGLPGCLAATITPEFILPLKGFEAGQMEGAARAQLDALFARDIERTAELTGLDLSDWLSSSYAEFANGQPQASRVGLQSLQF